MTRWKLLIVGAILLVFACGARSASAQPASQLRSDIENIAVSVRVWDSTRNVNRAVGSGFVIADDGRTLTVVTAGHVVRSARGMADRHVQVLFHGARRWLDTDLAEPLPAIDGVELDLAVLTLPRRSAPIAGREPIAQMMLSPDPSPGDPLWSLARDVNSEVLSWRDGTANQVHSTELSFDGRTIEPGCSGGILLSTTGPVGLITQEGSQGSGHRAIRIATILQHLAAQNLSLIISKDPLGDALANTFQRQLAIGLFIWSPKTGAQTRSSWAAIELTDAGSNRYEGTIVSTEGGAPCAFEFVDGSWVLRITGATRINQNPPIHLSGSIALRAQSEVTLPGFVVMNLDHDEAGLQLAIPLRNTEMLAARALMSNRSGNKAVLTTQDEQRVIGMWVVNRDRRVRGVFPPFVLNLGPGTSLSFTLERRHHRSQEVRLVGELVDVDMLRTRTQTYDRAMIEQWRSIDLQVMPIGGDKAEAFVTSMSKRGPIEIIMQPDAGRFVLCHPGLITQGNSSVAADTAPILINARLIYAD